MRICGCSLRFPENTLEAFVAACKIQGLTGIELDIHLLPTMKSLSATTKKLTERPTGPGKLILFHLRT